MTIGKNELQMNYSVLRYWQDDASNTMDGRTGLNQMGSPNNSSVTACSSLVLKLTYVDRGLAADDVN